MRKVAENPSDNEWVPSGDEELILKEMLLNSCDDLTTKSTRVKRKRNEGWVIIVI